MSLPQFVSTSKLAEDTKTTQQSVIKSYNGLITNLIQIFTSLLTRVQLDSVLLTNIQLNAGTVTIIPHTLGRTLTGWKITRQRGATTKTIYDTQDSNINPGTYLQLMSDTAVSVDIEVF